MTGTRDGIMGDGRRPHGLAGSEIPMALIGMNPATDRKYPLAISVAC
jgi:hypothetical protein